jgi:hypothetical protein
MAIEHNVAWLLDAGLQLLEALNEYGLNEYKKGEAQRTPLLPTSHFYLPICLFIYQPDFYCPRTKWNTFLSSP